MKNLLLILLFLIATVACAQTKSGDEQKIRDLLQLQTKEWNKGNLEGFMQTYWQSDSLLFIGKGGVTRGWQQTLDNYKKGYPDKAAMGALSFDVIEVRELSPDHYFVVGKWTLRRTAGNLSGHYSLLVRKIKGGWKIVADHSS